MLRQRESWRRYVDGKMLDITARPRRIIGVIGYRHFCDQPRRKKHLGKLAKNLHIGLVPIEREIHRFMKKEATLFNNKIIVVVPIPSAGHFVSILNCSPTQTE
ncbi:UNVERIFIED_CONTAM: hypothetical protein Sindi_2436000 [Sesamum indicum]